MVTTDNIVTPFIVLGLKKGEISLNISPDLVIISIEKNPFLAHLKTYLKPSIYTRLNAISNEYLIVADMPPGISIVMDENLNASVDLTPEVMSDISPEIYMNKPKVRNTKQTKSRSVIADINIRATDESTRYSADTRLRFDNYYFSAKNNFGVKTEILQDYLIGYAAPHYDVLLGHIHPPSFAGLYPHNIHGTAWTNSLLSGSVVLESDPRYINLSYESTIQIYVNDVLQQEKIYPAGRHRLNLPINTQKSNIKIVVTDKYGREKTIDFNFAGKNSSKIPTAGQLLYFAGIGENEEQYTEFYGGVQFGIDTTSKMQLATLLNTDTQLLNVNYYLAIPVGELDTYAATIIDDGMGVSLQGKWRGYFERFSLATGIEWAQNYYQRRTEVDAQNIKLNMGYRHSAHLTTGAGVEYDFLTGSSVYDMSVQYSFNNGAGLMASYTKGIDETRYQIGLEYPLGADTVANTYYTQEGLASNIQHQWQDNNSLSMHALGSQESISFRHIGDIATTEVTWGKQQTTGEIKHTFQTNFSLVATPESVDSTQRIGNSSFVTLRTEDDFQHNMEVRLLDESCYLEHNTICTMKVPPNRENYFFYNLDNMPLNIKVAPASDTAVFVAGASGKTLTLHTKELFFIQGRALQQNKGVSLLIGEIIASDGSSAEVFTDEEGGFFVEGLDGEYTLKFGKLRSQPFQVRKEKAEEGLIDVGDITLSAE